MYLNDFDIIKYSRFATDQEQIPLFNKSPPLSWSYTNMAQNPHHFIFTHLLSIGRNHLTVKYLLLFTVKVQWHHLVTRLFIWIILTPLLLFVAILLKLSLSSLFLLFYLFLYKEIDFDPSDFLPHSNRKPRNRDLSFLTCHSPSEVVSSVPLSAHCGALL